MESPEGDIRSFAQVESQPPSNRIPGPVILFWMLTFALNDHRAVLRRCAGSRQWPSLGSTVIAYYLHDGQCRCSSLLPGARCGTSGAYFPRCDAHFKRQVQRRPRYQEAQIAHGFTLNGVRHRCPSSDHQGFGQHWSSSQPSLLDALHRALDAL
jgi:hypothetical protein